MRLFDGAIWIVLVFVAVTGTIRLFAEAAASDTDYAKLIWHVGVTAIALRYEAKYRGWWKESNGTN